MKGEKNKNEIYENYISVSLLGYVETPSRNVCEPDVSELSVCSLLCNVKIGKLRISNIYYYSIKKERSVAECIL